MMEIITNNNNNNDEIPPLPQTPRKSKRLRDRDINNKLNSSISSYISPENSPIKTKKQKLNIKQKPSFKINKLPPSPEKSPFKKPTRNIDSSVKKLEFGTRSLYSRTKSLLQRSSILTPNDQQGSLLTRETQCRGIVNFLDDNIINHKSNSLYITGPPGTGKTAQLETLIKYKFLPIDISEQFIQNENHNIVNKFNPILVNNNYYHPSDPKIGAQRVNIASINCIAIKEPSQIFQRIYESFVTENYENEHKMIKTMLQLQTFMEQFSKETTFVVILDEMDKLVRMTSNDTHATRIIFELFMLARLPHINFILIGIANSLDMKDKFLSRLNLRQDLLPKTIVFNPYSADEMFDIVMNKINTLEDNVFNPMAIKFATKKCSGNTGDLRRLLDILRHSIELVELTDMIERKRGTIPNNDNDQPIKKIGLQHIAKVFSTISNSSSTKSRIEKINMQQKIILCSLVQREKTDIFQSCCTLDDAFSYYFKLLNSKNVFKPMNRNEFLEICNALETCGLVEISTGRSPGKTRHMVKLIKTTVDDKEFTREISKTDILKNFLTL
ncbi:AAA ATPase [Maudiozyma exigua]|uniref:Cell division control protein n=1 Tax=Maudiozyma exigua TaxID=34358 RepID=A0A9P6WFL5_MAUEX|nr:AAA ATPase [Kazachstania exigua]